MVTIDGQDHDAVGGHSGSLIVLDVCGDGRLAVGADWHKRDPVQAPCGRHGSQELPDRVAAPVGGGQRRHGQQRVLPQEGQQGSDVAGVPCRHVPVEQPPFRVRVETARCQDRPPSSAVVVQSGSGSVEEAVHSGDGGVEDVRGLGGGEPQDVAEQEDRPLPGGQELDSRQKGEVHTLGQVKGHPRARFGRMAELGVGKWLKRGHLDVEGVRRWCAESRTR